MSLDERYKTIDGIKYNIRALLIDHADFDPQDSSRFQAFYRGKIIVAPKVQAMVDEARRYNAAVDAQLKQIEADMEEARERLDRGSYRSEWEERDGTAE